MKAHAETTLSGSEFQISGAARDKSSAANGRQSAGSKTIWLVAHGAAETLSTGHIGDASETPKTPSSAAILIA